MQTIVHSPTPDLNKSRQFYLDLGYTDVSDTVPNIFTDGNAIIEINPDRFARPGIKMYKENWEVEVKAISKFTTVHSIENGFVLSDLNGCWIYLIESRFVKIDLSSIKKNSAIPGNFAGISLESTNMVTSLDIWHSLGFARVASGAEDSYVVLGNSDGFNVSLMKPLTCPHLFFNPSLTYFNGNENLTIIEKIRLQGIAITEEITHFNNAGIVDNIIIQDPGGYGFFIFND